MLLLASLLCITHTNAQRNGSVYYDSTYVRSRNQPQYRSFLAGTSHYPAPLRSQWELGVKTGSMMVMGDVGGELVKPSFGMHLRKALNYTYSVRLSYTYGQTEGIGADMKNSYQLNPAWDGYNGKHVFYNYQTTTNDLALEGIAVLDNVKFHRSNRNLRLYVLAGVGLTTYQTRVNKLDAAGRLYNFRPVLNTIGKKSKHQIREEVRAILDDSYETAAENDGNTKPKVFGVTAMPLAHFGVGLAFKLNNRLNLALEERFTLTSSDLLDGNQWEDSEVGPPFKTRSRDALNFLSLGLNVNLGRKATEPLWWINPLQYPYSELRNPQQMRLPRVVLPDADGDGITDQFDLEQTPAGVPVDQRGVSRDSDGDGVPDAIDKEPMTPTQCQPVNKDGVGKCPCPEDCLPRK
ncbi:hypothetical protein SAMN05444008_109182 [Cnuella takakiae]|uniref:OmpA family protein n=1 Tax=Cnuella takakiae TaxID=1302690 RepID=A0A1M5CR87_9BACT|nr:hypothetical protein SAMN05444008_109182 [Cnuella takakiae]